MKKFDIDKMIVGFVLGLFIPMIVLVGYYKINYSYLTVNEFLKFVKLANSHAALVSLSILFNLAVFFPFIWKDKNLAARGVLASTFIWAGVVVYIKYFVEV